MHQIGSVIRTFVVKPIKSPVPAPRPVEPNAQKEPATQTSSK